MDPDGSLWISASQREESLDDRSQAEVVLATQFDRF